MNNEERISEMLGSLNTTFNTLVNKVDNLDQEIQIVKNATARIEHEHGQSLKALHDGYAMLYDISKEIRDSITDLHDEQEEQDTQIKVLKYQKKS